MKGFLFFLLGLAVAAAGFFAWRHFGPGSSTGSAMLSDAGAPGAAKKRKKRTRGAARVARASSSEGHASPSESAEEAEPVRLSPADLRLLAQGDDLSKPDVLRLDMSNDRELSELSQDEIDTRFRAQEPAILDCIAQARPDPETYVPGRVTVKFRIQRVGTVRGVRVEAPAVLQKNGLYGCIKGVVGRLHFPAAGTSQILSYPFTLS